jgi:hypothetical protein
MGGQARGVGHRTSPVQTEITNHAQPIAVDARPQPVQRGIPRRERVAGEIGVDGRQEGIERPQDRALSRKPSSKGFL